MMTTIIEEEKTTNEYRIISMDELTGEESVSREVDAADILRSKINEAIAVSKELNKKVKEAKTKPKRDLYFKKLQKNNQTIFELLVSVQRLSNAK